MRDRRDHEIAPATVSEIVTAQPYYPALMRRVVITKHGSREVLQAADAADPIPGLREVRLALRDASVNAPYVSRAARTSG